MRADLIERLIERLRHRAECRANSHLPPQNTLEWEAADALASLSSPQEPIGYVHPEDITEMKEFGRCYIWKSPVKNGYPLFASPVVPVAAKAEAEGWRPEATAPRDGTIVDLWLLNRKTGNGWRETDCSFSRGEANPYWLKNSRFITGKRYMDDDGDWCLDPGCADQESIVATHWRLPPTAPTCEGEGT